MNVLFELIDKIEEKLGHSLHPAIVSLPLGALTVSAISDILGLATGQRDCAAAARISMGIGLVGGAGAIATGLHDFSYIPKDRPTHAIAVKHGTGMAVAASLFAASFFLREQAHLAGDGEPSLTARALALSGWGVALYSAYLGGVLVEEYGEGVKPVIERQKKETRERKEEREYISSVGGRSLARTNCRPSGKPIVKKHAAKKPVVVLTIGHSTRPLDLFLQLLQAHGVTRLVDVRTIPRSWHNPQFNQETLPTALRSAGLSYRHMAGLGGLRHSRPDSPNQAWRNTSFRGFADYMQTPEFAENLQVLIDMAGQERVALMCAEAVPWRCHRSLIADALTARGLEVEHIMSATQCRKHTLRQWAVVKGKRITYPSEPGPGPSPSSKMQAKQRPQISKGDRPMARDFKVGDHVAWNSEAGRVRGTIEKKVTSAIAFKGYTVLASKEEPQYLIKSDKTDHLAMHKGSALRAIRKSKS